jgi:uncharacterized protein YcbK (DUF882 family)
MGNLSLHFSKKEMACHCCGTLKVEQRLLNALEKLRALSGQPLLVHDAYRCPEHNEQVGGVPDSEHTRGMAADVKIPGLSLQQMYELALEVPEFAEGGIGVYDGGFLHLDVRPHSARWARVRGQYVGVQHLVRQPIMTADAQIAGERAG